MLTLPPLLTCLEFIYSCLDLRAQVRTMESCLIYHVLTVGAIPPESILTVCWSWLFEHNADCVCKSNRIMWCVWREQKHLALTNDDVAKFTIVYDFEHHGALVLKEVLRCLVDVVVGSCVRTTNNHDGHIVIVDAVIVDRRLEKMGIFGKPERQSELNINVAYIVSSSRLMVTHDAWWGSGVKEATDHLGKLSGLPSMLDEDVIV